VPPVHPSRQPLPALPPRVRSPAQPVAHPPRRALIDLVLPVVVIVAGTGVAVGADLLVGRFDGSPPVYVLVLFLLPFWDVLPDRPLTRLAALAGLASAVAAGWLALALRRPEAWWRGEISFGLACLLVATAHGLLRAAMRTGRTVSG
jgi:hypothetical protein